MADEMSVFKCAVAVYRTSSAPRPPELGHGFKPWSLTPFENRGSETAIEYRVLNNAAGCWSESIREAAGFSDPFNHVMAGQQLTSFDHVGHVAIFDPQHNIFIAIAG